MTFVRRVLASYFVLTLAAAALAGPGAAFDSGNFIIRLGEDTTSVEHYTRTPSSVIVDQVGRAPRVLRRHFEYNFAGGSISHFAMVVTAPGSEQPTQTIDASFGPDSMRMVVKTGDTPARNVNLAMSKGTVVVASSSPWVIYEEQIMKLVKGKPDSLRAPLYFLGADALNWLSLHKRGSDSVVVFNDHGDLFNARVDGTGHVLGVLPIAGTAKFSVERVANLDLDGMAGSFAAREQAGAGMGMLSPRDSVVVTAGGAALWIDYGRPGKRGRQIFGGVVPYGEVWRTGANAATQFKTDKALVMGGTEVPAGFYTLWTIPSADGWKLVINSETGQWGTAHKADKDLYTIDMKVRTLPKPVERFTISVDPKDHGGMLNLDWDTTRAAVEFTVKP